MAVMYRIKVEARHKNVYQLSFNILTNFVIISVLSEYLMAFNFLEIITARA